MSIWDDDDPRVLVGSAIGTRRRPSIWDLPDPEAVIEAASPPATGESPGFAGTIWGGAKKLGRNIAAVPDLIQGDTEEARALAQANQDQVQNDSLRALMADIAERKQRLGPDAGWLETGVELFGAVARNPKGAGLLVAEQLPNAAAVLGGAAAGAAAGAKLGAVAGTAIAPGVGTVAGGILGGIAGMFGANFAIEGGAKTLEHVGAGGELDAENQSRLLREGVTKAGVITAIDVATFGASKWLLGTAARATEAATTRTLLDAGINSAAIKAATQAPAREAAAEILARAGLTPEIAAAVRQANDAALLAVNAIGRKAARGGGVLALETVGEGAGEYLGEYAATGKLDKMEALIEAFSSLGQSGGEVLVARALNRAQAADSLSRIASAATVDDAIEAADEAVSTATADATADAAAPEPLKLGHQAGPPLVDGSTMTQAEAQQRYSTEELARLQRLAPQDNPLYPMAERLEERTQDTERATRIAAERAKLETLRANRIAQMAALNEEEGTLTQPAAVVEARLPESPAMAPQLAQEALAAEQAQQDLPSALTAPRPYSSPADTVETLTRLADVAPPQTRAQIEAESARRQEPIDGPTGQVSAQVAAPSGQGRRDVADGSPLDAVAPRGGATDAGRVGEPAEVSAPSGVTAAPVRDAGAEGVAAIRAKQISEQQPAAPVAESRQVPAPEAGDDGVASIQGGAAAESPMAGIEANAVLDAAQVTGRDRLEAIEKYRAGTYSLDDMKAAYPAKATDKESLVVADKQAAEEDIPADTESPEAGQEQGAAADKAGDIADFGQKLGGARKDQDAALRDAISRELSDEEIAALPLSKIWPKESIDEIKDPFIAAVAHAARAEIPSKPRKPYAVRSWVEKVKTLRGLTGHMLRGTVSKERFSELMKSYRGLDQFATKVALLEAIDRANWDRIGKVEEYPEAYSYDKEGKKVPSPIVRVEIDGKARRYEANSVADVLDQVRDALGEAPQAKRMEFEVRGREGAYFINKKGDKLYRKLKTFETSKEAFDFRAKHYAELVAAWESVKDSDNVKETDVRGKENRPRTAQDWRQGKDVSPEQFNNTFGFRGVEWGNWVSQGKSDKERQGMLNEAFDAFMDLADIIAVPPKALSLNGTLGLGFGSRGSGWASAHFEPGALVINLTKTRGAGALAHEWFHALDNYFQRFRGEPAGTKREDYFITYAPENYYVHKTTGFKLPQRAFIKMIDGERHPDYGTLAARYRERAQWELKEGVRPEIGESFADLVQALNESPMAKRASLIDKGKSGGYWSRIIERGARSFENYVIHKMMLKGYHNDYLANVTSAEDFQRDPGRYPYLLESEIEPVADAFDALFATIETKETERGTAMFSRSQELSRRAAFKREALTLDIYPYSNGLWGMDAATFRLGNPRDIGAWVESRSIQYQIRNDKGERIGTLVLSMRGHMVRGLSAIEIDEALRGQGIGRQIVTQLVSTYGKINIDGIRDSARGFWDNLGTDYDGNVPEQDRNGTIEWRDLDATRDRHAGARDTGQDRGRDEAAGSADERGGSSPSRGVAGEEEALSRTPPQLGRTSSGLSVSALESDPRIQKIRAKWRAATVRFVQSEEDLPSDGQSLLGQDEGGAIEGAWFPDTNEIILVVDSLQTVERTLDVVAHEAVGHYAQERLVKSETFRNTLANVDLLVRTKNAKALEWAKRVDESQPGLSKDKRLKEILAVAAESGEYKLVPALKRLFSQVITQANLWLKGQGFDVSEAFVEQRIFAALREGERALARPSEEMTSEERVPAYSKENAADPGLRDALTFAQKQKGREASELRELLSQNYGLASVLNGVAYPSDLVKMIGEGSALYSRATPYRWEAPEPSKIDDVIYALQDKQVDMKRIVGAILDTAGRIADQWNPYLQEELFHGRAAKGVKDFLDFELRPLMQDLRMRGVAMTDFEEYLWHRHAEERNEQIAKINPDMPDGGSGLKTAAARKYLAGLPASKKAAYEALAKRIDAINAKTRQVLVSSGLEKPETIAAWEGAYQHYVPLQREDVETGGTGTGKGYSVRGSSSKRAVGSNKPVADILGNIAQQRERAIVRAEKNRVSNALFGLAAQNPNADFWKVDDAPTERVVETRAGKDQVIERVVPGFRNQDNVVLTRINGEDHFVIFSERDPRAVRMAQALKNLDADQLGRVLSATSKVTRYLASINTQYNPVFGVINLIRDTQGALLNLSTTPIKGEQRKVLGYTVDALRGIYVDLRDHRRGKVPSSSWAQLFEEFQKEGGQTGYRDMYSNAERRAEAIAREIKALDRHPAIKAGGALFNWLSDYNETMENAVRLAAYRTAKERGLSKQQAASIAKNLTVNFNRKGQVAIQMGALYAFFNASVQGTARMAETLTGPMGKKIITGGILLGAMQALLLAAAGFDDDEPPEFVRQRSLILPIGNGKYLSLAMPLGFHILPNLGRIPLEFVMGGFRNPAKRIAEFVGLFADTFNPVGNAGFSLQTFAPSVADPFVALAENRDWTGKPITREANPMAPTPGHARAKDTATTWSKATAYGINWLSGGTKYKPGLFSPTPDQLDYLIGQATGGVGREVAKIEQTVGSAFTGEELPLHKIPLVGRFLGDTSGQSAEGGRFYEAIKRINEHEAELKGLRTEGKGADVTDYLRRNPEAWLVNAANTVERQVQKLRRAKRDAIAAGNTERVRLIERQITTRMAGFNARLKSVE